jgi:effector-binding domain-containing protein
VEGIVRSIGRLVPFVVPATELAVLMHQGSLANIDITYGELGAYATAHEISIEGPLREDYLVDAQAEPDPEAWRTEIGWPIFRSDGQP